MKRSVSQIVRVAVCVLATTTASCVWAHPAREGVATDRGVVIGTQTEYGRQFLGIPYAAPPIGKLRWRPPVIAPRWSTPRLAQQFGNSCPQTASPFGLASVDEDCLYLNVYTPPRGHRAQRYPVMVWFHPGAFQFGEADDYDPRKLVSRGVIVVTVNYRLGTLGFLAHPALSAGSRDSTSGNYGILDQQAALRWVRKNIDGFGGDPREVTLFGGSAGGLSVLTHLVSPQSRGLFGRAIVQSGAYSLQPPTLAEAEAQGGVFAAAAGCEAQDAQCLRALPVGEILAKQIPGVLGFLPTVDGKVLPRAYGEAFATGRFNRVPVMQGSTHDEYRLFVPLFFDFVNGPATPELYPAGISLLLGVPPADVPAIMSEYPLANYADTDTALATLATDAVFACNRERVTDGLMHHVPTWTYEFNDTTAPQRYLPPASVPYGAYHESELQYLFDLVTNAPTVPLDASQRKLSGAMVAAWANFAQTGNPNLGAKGIAWPLWLRAQTGYVQRWQEGRGHPYAASEFSRDHRCDFWKSR